MKSTHATLFAAFIALLTPHAARAEIVMLQAGEDVESAINAAQPGDEIVLEAGTYELTDRFGISVRGTESAPIIVRGEPGERPVLNRATADQNVIDVDDAEYLVLRGLEISGGSHGVRLVSARFVTVEDCDIHDTGDVALSANSGGSYEGLQILRNEIHHTNNTGEGMYLGCNENACRMFDSLIEGNHVHHTNGPTVEQGDGIEIKEGSYNNVVRDNVIHDTNYPCILTYSTVGNGAPNLIERNVLWNCGDHGIQSAADAIIRNNIILGSGSNGIAMQPHQSGAPDHLIVVHNTVLHASNDAISASDIAGSVVIANNALYAQSGMAIRASGELAGLVLAGNVGEGGADPDMGFAMGMLSADFVAASYSGTVPNDVFPSAGSALIGAGDAEHVVDDDFNGTPREGVADVGAYAFDADGNPGWALAEAFKDATATPPVSDAGMPGGAGGAGGGGGAGAGGMDGSGGTTFMNGASGMDGSDAGAMTDGGGGDPSAGKIAVDNNMNNGCSCRIAPRAARSSVRPLLALLALALFSLAARRCGRAARSGRPRA